MDVRNDLHVQRKFGFCKISWTIERFWLLTCNKSWEICSPEFSVRASQSTSWKMILKPTPKQNDSDYRHLIVYLKRLESDSGPEIVRANWKLSLLNCKRKTKANIFTEIECLFSRNHSFGEIIEDMNCIQTDLKPFEIDDLIIECQLIVSCDTDFIPFFKCTDNGIRSLSDDLCILSRNIFDFDVKIRIENFEIPAYKAILHARNSTFASIIEKNRSIQVIDLLSSDFCDPRSLDCSESCLFSSTFLHTDAVERIVDYIYSGKLEEVIGKPSICISVFAMVFDIKEVLAYYIPDELFLTSAVDVDENVFSWFITSFEFRKEDLILSPLLTKGQMKSVWRLKLFPKGTDNKGEYVSLYAEIFEERIAQYACIEFAVMDANKEFRGFRRIQKPLGLEGAILGFDDFIKRDDLENDLFLNCETLCIIFKLRTSTGNFSVSSELTSTTSVISPPKEYNLTLLSKEIADMFNKSDFSDFKIRCNNESFEVHTCIMMARSDNFSQILREHRSGTNEIDISFIKVNILRILLFYIYSGILKKHDLKDIHKVYFASKYFGVEALTNTCSRIIADSYPRPQSE